MATPTEPKRGRPATGKTAIRHIRVGDIWDEAARIAEYRGENMTVVVRRAIEAYVRRHRHEVPDDYVSTPSPKRKLPTPREPVSGAPVGYSEARPYVVADRLANLRGPTTGIITLPRHIDWSGSPQRDLDAPGELATMYPTVLAEASSADDLNNLLDKATLIRLWPTLFLPRKVRRLWEEKFPSLAATRTPKK